MEDIVQQLKFRFAEPRDVDFIIESIIAAEKGITDTINTCKIFSLNESEFRSTLKKVLLEDIPDYDYWLSGYLIAELNGVPVCSQGAWVEGLDGIPSYSVKSAMLMEYLPREKFDIDCKTHKLVDSLSIKREIGTLQLEHDYTIPNLRRKGIHLETVLEMMERSLDRYPGVTKIQTIPFKENYKTYNEYLKIGFTPVIEKRNDDSQILNIFAGNTRVLMELTSDQLKEAILKFKSINQTINIFKNY